MEGCTEKAIEEGRRPAWKMMTATGASSDTPEIEIETLLVTIEGFPTSSRTFGRLVHGLLQCIPLEDAGNGIDALARCHAQSLGLTPEHSAAAANAVRAVISTPIFRRASRAQRVLREAPFILKTGNGTLRGGPDRPAFPSTRTAGLLSTTRQGALTGALTKTSCGFMRWL